MVGAASLRLSSRGLNHPFFPRGGPCGTHSLLPIRFSWDRTRTAEAPGAVSRTDNIRVAQCPDFGIRGQVFKTELKHFLSV